MFGTGEMIGGSIAVETHRELNVLLRTFSSLMSNGTDRRGLGAGNNPFVHPRNFVVVVDTAAVHLVVENRLAGAVPIHTYLDIRADGIVTQIEDAEYFARSEKGLGPCVAVDLPIEALGAEFHEQVATLAPVVSRMCDWLKERDMIESLDVPEGYEHLRRFMPSFLKDHPEVKRNVFLMMRFDQTRPHEQIQDTIRSTLAAAGYHVLRADDKAYASELWDNVAVYMIGCALGVVVFDEISERSFNPSVALELGFMLALNRRVLVLKDQSMPKMPTDIVGRLYKTFSPFDVRTTLESALASWLRDID